MTPIEGSPDQVEGVRGSLRCRLAEDAAEVDEHNKQIQTKMQEHLKEVNAMFANERRKVNERYQEYDGVYLGRYAQWFVGFFFLNHTLEYDLRCKQMKSKERKLGLIVLFNSQYESFCVFHITFATEKNLTYPKSDKDNGKSRLHIQHSPCRRTDR